jgi:4a-hydroxytetrahydrobiopterin dehydratase
MMNIEHWINDGNALNRTFKFDSFTAAFVFMTRVAFEAEKQNHHPDWRNSYNVVAIKLSTHDAGNTVTDNDLQLARAINLIYDNLKQ